MTRTFLRHYAEMVAAMLLGMLVLGAPAGLVFDYGDDAQMVVAMAITMTVPMAAWMRYRGHAWRPTIEMSAAMVLPAAAVLALLAGDVVTDLGALLALEHVAMFGGMLAAMLLRSDEYAGHGHGQVTA